VNIFLVDSYFGEKSISYKHVNILLYLWIWFLEYICWSQYIVQVYIVQSLLWLWKTTSFNHYHDYWWLPLFNHYHDYRRLLCSIIVMIIDNYFIQSSWLWKTTLFNHYHDYRRLLYSIIFMIIEDYFIQSFSWLWYFKNTIVFCVC
jgi:hypothetical protein